MTQAYPLQWPDGWTRTPAHKREDGRSRFRRRDGSSTTIASTRTELADELQRLGVCNVVLSTNVELRLDGLPYSNRRAPDDPGIAVYFTLDGESMVMAQDAFDRVPDNIRSLTLAIHGMRQMRRHGGGTMLKRAFSGFTALPPPSADFAEPAAHNRAWFDVLGVQPDAPDQVVKVAYRELCKGADEDQLYELNAAKEAWKASRGQA